MLLHIPEVLKREEVVELRAALDRADWADGRETVGALGASVKRNEQLPDVSPLRHELGQKVLAALDRNPLYFSAALPVRTLAPRFNRYTGGGQYGMHIDGAVMVVNKPGGQREHVRSDISCTLFLCDPDEYDGGELVVSDTYGEHEVKLPAGDLVIYPSSSLHKVQPVTRGSRLASFFWVQSMVRDDAHRRLLFDMDRSIETLRRTGADAEAVLRITGAYHNLLREWAEV
ncbi:MAG: Fe2+-dependent dioxygenase [Gammaproteobacteria bacterium]